MKSDAVLLVVVEAPLPPQFWIELLQLLFAISVVFSVSDADGVIEEVDFGRDSPANLVPFDRRLLPVVVVKRRKERRSCVPIRETRDLVFVEV